MEAVALLLVIAMVVPATMFPILYHRRQPWWRTLQGRAIMTLSTGFALLVDAAVLYELVPAFPGKDIARLVIYTVILAGFCWLNVALLRTPRGR